MSWNSCATNMPIAGWAFPTAKWKAGSPPPACKPAQRDHRAAQSQSEKLTVKLWLATAKAQSQKGSRMSLRRPDRRSERRLQVSFEFSPPKTDEAEANAVDRDPAAGAAGARPLSRSPMARAARRASAPMPPSSASSRKPALKPAAHLTCVGASRRRDRRYRARLLGRRHPPYRGAARRHAGHGRALSAACRRLSIHAGTDRGHPQHRAVRGQRVLLSRAASGFAQPRP